MQLGQTEGDLIEIKSGVAENEIVATSNVEQLSDGCGKAIKSFKFQVSVSSQDLDSGLRIPNSIQNLEVRT